MPKSKPKRRDSVQLVRNALEYFIGGVPPFGYFELEVTHLVALVKSSKKDKFSSLNPTAEVALIGLSAYFEAFCKAQFAALVNICPQILSNFVARRQNSTVSLKHILAILPQAKDKLGSVISEEHDFGSAKEINGLYQDLLRITPFSAKETKDYYRRIVVATAHVSIMNNTGEAQRAYPAFSRWATVRATVSSYPEFYWAV